MPKAMTWHPACAHSAPQRAGALHAHRGTSTMDAHLSSSLMHGNQGEVPSVTTQGPDSQLPQSSRFHSVQTLWTHDTAAGCMSFFFY